mgnify:CR=1 FL=1
MRLGVALGSLVLLGGCTDGMGDARFATPVPLAAVAAVPDARALLLLRSLPGGDVSLEYLAEVSAPVQALNLRAEIGRSRINEGVAGPLLSADGRWIAMMQDGQIVVRRVDGSTVHTIASGDPERLYLLLCGFSPDSATLLYRTGGKDHLEWGERQAVGRFDLLTLADLTTREVEELGGFRQWFPDSRQVMFVKPGKGDYNVVAWDVYTGDWRIVQKYMFQDIFDEPTVHDALVYVRDTKIVAHELTGGRDYVRLTEVGQPGQYSRPSFSLDGTRVAYADDQDIRVVALADPKPETWMTCTARCRFDWDSPTTLLVIEGGVLLRVSQGAPAEVITSEVRGFAIAGR